LTYLSVLGKESANIFLTGNDLRKASTPFVVGKEVAKSCVIDMNNLHGGKQ
jgi:hypothetical protein